MVRNLKTLGLTLVSILAIGALSVPMASAADLSTALASKAWVTGTSHNTRITFTGGPSFECTTSSLIGTIDSKSPETMTMLPLYKGKVVETPHTSNGCTGLTIAMNDCHYRLTGDTDAKDFEQTDATFSIQCPENKAIETTLSGCPLKIPSQTPTAGGVTYANLPNHSGGSAIQVTTTVTGITYTAPELCTVIGIPPVGDEFDIIGTIVLTAYQDPGGTMTAPTEGARAPISVS
jgi:hypothetical protein